MENIVSHRLSGPKRTAEVLVQWVGYPGQDTWEPLDNLLADSGCEIPQFLNTYMKNKTNEEYYQNA